MRRVIKIHLNGFIQGVIVTLVICSGLYFTENRKLPFIGDNLVTGWSARKIAEIEHLIDENFLGEIDKKALEDYICYGLMSGLNDKYSSYFTPEQYAAALENSNGAYVGVGFVMEQNTETNIVTIKECYPKSPAAKAGILPGDILYKVNDKIVSEMTITEVSDYIMEEEKAAFYIQREGMEELLEIEIEIGDVEVPSVYSRELENAIGYIQINQFTEVTSRQFKEAYQELLQNGMKGLIVDLRENPGGLLTSVCDTLRQILPKGLIMYTEDKHGNIEEQTCDGETPIEIPMVLLVNGNSASAAEIFAGAVKDYNIAALVGEKTFGKGIVQKYFSFPDGSGVKMTSSKYYTPNGICIHGEGIAPDVETVWAGENAFHDPADYNTLEEKEWKEQDNQFASGAEVLSRLMEEE